MGCTLIEHNFFSYLLIATLLAVCIATHPVTTAILPSFLIPLLVRFINNNYFNIITIVTVAYQKAQLHEIILVGVRVKPSVQHRKSSMAEH